MTESLTFFTAFMGGLVSFLSPCVLPLMPGYMSWMAGHQHREGESAQTRRFLAACLFVLGFSTVFIAMGAGFSMLGSWLQQHKADLAVGGGILIFLFGLMMTGWLKIGWLMRDHRFHPQHLSDHPLSAYLLGLSFAFGWTPCIGPVLGAILTVSTVSATAMQGTVLLSVYSLGLAVPFLLLAWFFEPLRNRMKRFYSAGARLYQISGVLMMLMGIALATGWITRLGTWLLETFPVFTRIG
ncbi:cytochrome c biogenesis protein CcdA [Hahella sp. SMD15-11]|uniref:Cytochrome c biogenesis protein CcdA n=1 Tax=Thermohahella caldifontis TaxID=3142973 RepID=A0AB39UT82_9GAMM